MQRVRLHEIQHRAVDLRPFGLHHVEHKGRRSLPPLMHDALRRIEAFGDDLNSDLTFKHGVGIIQNCIDWMRRVPVARQLVKRRSRADCLPRCGE